MSDFLDILDGPKRPDVQFAPGPIGRDVTAYGKAALEGECANIRAVPIGAGRNDQLNRSAVKMGGLIAAGAIDEHTVIEYLGAADGGLDYPATRKTIMSGLAFGTQQARAIPDNRSASSSVIDSGRSDDPFSESYTATIGKSALQATRISSASSDDAAGSRFETPGESGDTIAELVRSRLPVVDWFSAWDGPTEVEWIIEPLLPARRLVAVYSAPKVGKSLLMLELAYHICQGTKVLGVTPARAYTVLYVDFENDLQGDIVPRLTNMGANPTQLDRLNYLSLPTLAGLDSEKGARELMAAVEVYGCEVVIIDTVSRSVDGEENENDTWLKFYRQTGLRLKQAGVAMIRLDHSGKDETKGQRGGSAKGGDIDAVWQMTRLAEDNFRLTCDMNRFPIPAAEKVLTLVRRENPLRHVIDAGASRETILESVIRACDEAELPVSAGWQKVRDVAADALIKVGQDRCIEVQKRRKARSDAETQPED
jgi:KaiC/GvpD/RAD55 family RecA-like ATPase